MKRKNFFKIEEVFTNFKRNISRAVEPGDFLTIDEQLYSYRGRCAFRMFMKPAKYGIKMWAITDTETSYLLNTDVYLGKSDKSEKRYYKPTESRLFYL